MQKPLLVAGILSDTHLPYRLKILPGKILKIFSEVDVILHAGDVDRLSCLDALQEIAPLYAVRGNFHPGDFSFGGRDLPFAVQLTLAGRQVLVTHGHQRGVWGALLKIPNVVASMFVKHADAKMNQRIANRLHKKYPYADVIIFGHTHKVFQQRVENTLFFNPGAVAATHKKKPSVGLLSFWEDKIEVKVIEI